MLRSYIFVSQLISVLQDELSASANGLVLTTDDNEDVVDMDDIFDLFDEDLDGKISYLEIDKVFQGAQMEPLSQFMPVPSGQDGALTRVR